MRFSVVVPAFNRPQQLAKLLDSIEAQTFTDYEVIVSDDGTDSCEEMIRSRYPWVKWVQGPHLGPAANRNYGARSAQGEWLVFTDDDCLVVPEWLESYNENTYLAACCALEGTIEPMTPIEGVFAECPVNTSGGVFWSANIAVFRKLFEQIGGFDVSFPYPAHEDEDLKLRLQKLTEIEFVPAAKVLHPVRVPTARQLMKLVGPRCSSWTYLQLKHGRVKGMFAFPLLVYGWARSWFPFLVGNIQLHSLRGVFVSLMGMFVLGPAAIFRTVYFNPNLQKLNS